MKENLKVKYENKDHRIAIVDVIVKCDLFNNYSFFCENGFVHLVCRGLIFEYKEITLRELRKLARPKEYLNDKYELVVTNQPKDGWLLVPDGAEFLAEFKDGEQHFYKKSGKDIYLDVFDHWSKRNSWTDTLYENIGDLKSAFELKQILWQRKQEETEMNTEKKGRFLHQEWYEAFGRGEDVQYQSDNLSLKEWFNVGLGTTFEIFNAEYIKFRIKPKTITINGHVINAPISVKPDKGVMYYTPCVNAIEKYTNDRWQDDKHDNEMFNRDICHLDKGSAIAHCDALLELMK